MGNKQKKQWILPKQNPQQVKKLAQGLNIRPIVAQILLNRGIDTVEAGKQFFQDDLGQTPDPFLMLDMQEAVTRLHQALLAEESITIYGDYDVDGQTATALLVLALRSIAPNPEKIDFYLPARLTEGYGLNKEALAELSSHSSLLVTVDCGISSIKEVAYAKKLGLEMIITDHHEPGASLPDAVAILNPKQKGCTYPEKNLAGVGVALKLLQGLGLKQEQWSKYLDLVALGTVADLVPLKGENRILVQHGLKTMADTKNLGLKALLEISEIEKPTAGALGFRLGPRLNAAGRLGDPTRGVQLLLSLDYKIAQELAAELNQENIARQKIESEVLTEAIDVVEKYQLYEQGALVLWGEDWHQGVVGIVASRLVERYYLPTIVISLQEGQGTASARSIAGLDLYETLSQCEHLLLKYGGHPMAAGLSLTSGNLMEFQALFSQLCRANLASEDYVPKIYVDGTLELAEVTFELIDELKSLEPHGLGNPAPNLQTTVSVLRTRWVGRENRHLQLTLQDQTNSEVAAIAFNAGPEREWFEHHAELVNLAFVPTINEWAGQRKLQLQLKDWQSDQSAESYVQRWMTEKYPWELKSEYYQTRSFQLLDQAEVKVEASKFVDLRGVWNKEAELIKRTELAEPALVLVNTPAQVLEVCRNLRIRIPGGTTSVGFSHELLSMQEQAELKQNQFKWIVSTGFGLKAYSWSSLWLWEPPLLESTLAHWQRLLNEEGQLFAMYGPQDVRDLQSYISQNFPDRGGFARIYSQLRTHGEVVNLDLAQQQMEDLNMPGILPIAFEIFSELGLWALKENEIVYRPPPVNKLDLNQTVLYNKVTKMRKQSLEYLKRCLERGFFHHELERHH